MAGFCSPLIKGENMKLSEVLNLNEGIKSLSLQKMDIDLSYDVIKFSKLIDEEIKIYDETRKKLIETLALKNEDGAFLEKDGQYVFGDNKEEFDKEYFKLMEKEIQIKLIKIKKSVLRENRAKLSPIDLVRLEKIIED